MPNAVTKLFSPMQTRTRACEHLAGVVMPAILAFAYHLYPMPWWWLAIAWLPLQWYLRRIFITLWGGPEAAR